MAIAPAAASRATGGLAPTRLISKSSFLVPPPIRLPHRAGGGNRAVLLGVGRRADNGSSSSEGGRLVDEDMATLRRRIREARAEDDGIFDADVDAGIPLPTEWTELERRHHGSYVAGVRSAVALLEVLLVNTRPGLGAGLLAVLLLGVPASLFLVCAQLIQAADSVWSG
ncbi:uncharacterized protein LOC8082977 [Sorghum bicolor]|uniref:Uncharacterized protein n=1 Tax=Sorghum bicolor TaxID=4558 RepID=C5Z0Z4_SORBI|nr:uncharacterized protein LOC8082977 [Sorghum bicolor]EES18510.1 hypothetical protein SORBI_3009G198600 [Sorghum bicolor]|eukprot:XP_002440080.1 uncharacterized protein LOC8082977 [Sorghum bicolor]